MQALFIGQTYIDITFLADHMPSGDEKSVADDYAVSFGGNAVTAAFCCAKLSIKPDLLAPVADDWLGRMFLDMASRYGVRLHRRPVEESSLSFIMPRGNKRAIVRCRDDDYLDTFARLTLDGCRALHLDGHQPDAAMHYAKAARQAGVLTSLDGGGLRSNTDELLGYIDVAVVAERFCEQLGKSHEETMAYLRDKGCKVGGVTRGERGLLWFEGDGPLRELPALRVPAERVIDTSGAGDVFHGAYVYSCIARPEASWEDHFRFANVASAYKVQHLGNEAGLPSLDDIRATAKEFDYELELEFRPARANVSERRSSRASS